MSEKSPWEHFSMEELTCSCGCGQMKMNADFMESVVRLRKLHGRGLRVSSAYRCPAHNAKVSSTGENGPHATGHAIDFQVSDPDLIASILYCLLSLGFGTGKTFTCFRLHQKGPAEGRFIHIDDLNALETGGKRPHIGTY